MVSLRFSVQTIFRNPTEVRSYVLPNPENCNVPASAMLVSDDSIVVVGANVPAAHLALHHWQPNTSNGPGTPFLFHHGRNAINLSGGAIMRIFKGSAGSVDDYQFPRAIAFAASAIQNSSVVVVTCEREVITGNYFILHFPPQLYCWKASIFFLLFIFHVLFVLKALLDLFLVENLVFKVRSYE